MAETDLARVRVVLMRELETINEYEELARGAESPQIRDFLLHLAEEEKEHVAEATYLLRQLDPGQQAHFEKDFSAEHFRSAAEAPAAAAQPTPAAAALQDLRIPSDPARVLRAIPAFPTSTAGALTVGPLKRK